MDIIVDTNIVFSTILNSNSRIGQILLNTGDKFRFFSCSFLKEEIDSQKVRLLQLTGISNKELDSILCFIYGKISFISENLIPKEDIKKADQLTRDIDGDDVLFVALSLFLNAKIWTGDKKLINGLAKKGFNSFLSTEMISEL